MDSEASYDKKIEPKDAWLDFSKTASELERQIRAYEGWPKSKTTINNRTVVVTKAHSLNIPCPSNKPGDFWKEGERFGFVTKQGVLEIDWLIPAGSKKMTAADYLKGHRLL